MSEHSPFAPSRPTVGQFDLDSESCFLLPATLAQPPGGRPGGSDPQFPGYVVHKEIARGGMGRVLAAHDLALDREVALKVLLRESPDGEMAERFRQEAKITARLPHPGIPPVYALGELPDGSPFLAMKLIKGRTLASLLYERKQTTDDLPRFVQVFEQLCQAVGFAHAQGIIHRDLKPANVMVGAFGEVQVMDWGLAVEMRTTEHGSPTVDTEPALATVAVRRSTRASPRLTMEGVVVGTPSYMAPEQARGEEPDARADVFAIGGILVEILVDRPPFLDEIERTTLEAAAAGDLFEVMAALDMCGADAELVALAKWCLSPRRADRPADAKAVADAVAAYRAKVEQRLQQAETMRAAAEARAAEEANTRRAVEQTAAEQRKRRRTQGALAAAILTIGGLIAGGAWWQDRQATERRMERERADAELRAELARAEAERRGTRHGVERAIELAAELRRQYRFHDAEAVLTNAGELTVRAGADDLGPVIEQAVADLAFVVALDEVRMRRTVWVDLGAGHGRFQEAEVPKGYEAAFVARGLDVRSGDPADVAARVAASAVRAALVSALDDWAAIERHHELRDRVLDVARRADPGDWLDRFRDPAVRADSERLQQLARDADPKALAPAALITLAEVIERRGLDPVRLLSAAQAAHPGDFLISFELAQWYFDRDTNRAIEQFRIARAVRPDNFAVLINLGALLERRGDGEGARECYRAAIRLDETKPMPHCNLGQSLWRAGDLRAAEASLREALRLEPGYVPAMMNLGVVLTERGDADGGLEYLREAVRRHPTHADTQNNLGNALKRRGDLAGAIQCFREAVRIHPRYAIGHYNLGLCLRVQRDLDAAEQSFREAIRIDPGYAWAHHGLALTRLDRGDVEEAVRHLRESVRLDPNNVMARYNLGNVLREKSDLDGAAASYREALARNPQHTAAHVNLGITLRLKGDMPAAIKCFREAIRLDPNYTPGHEQLGMTFAQLKDWANAAECYREVIRLNPDDPAPPTNRLGILLGNQGDIDGAIRCYRDAIGHNPKFAPSHTNLGHALLSKGELDAAEQCFRDALQLDPQSKASRTGLQKVEMLRAEQEARTAPPPRPVGR